MTTYRLGLLAGVFACTISTAASAHVTLETPSTAQKTTYKGVLRVPHGCDGKPTNTLRISIPGGVVAVKPMPKAGWTLSTTIASYRKAHDYFGKPVTAGVTEIVWSGGSLLDDHYDEFVFRAYVTDGVAAGSVLPFPVVQECGTVTERWTELAAEGQDGHALKNPAPTLKIAAAPRYTVGALVIEAPWSRATPPGARVAGGYVTIRNTGTTSDRLIGGSAVVARGFEVHEMSDEGGVMKMRQLGSGLEIGPGQTVTLKPGGLHLMLMDLKRPLVANETVSGTLIFQTAGSVTIEYRVAPIGAQSGGGGHQHH